MSEREAFLEGIANDPRDLTVRRIFADWLDEHDEPELADFHRQWTVQKYDDASKWLHEFAEFLGKAAVAEYADLYDAEYNGPKFSAEEILSTMQEFARTGEGGMRLHFETPDECWSGQTRMWECYELITGQKVTEHIKEEGFFRCGC